MDQADFDVTVMSVSMGQPVEKLMLFKKKLGIYCNTQIIVFNFLQS